MSKEAEANYKHGQRFPYDAPDSWWHSNKMPPPAAKDWAHAAARGILADLGDRRGIKQELEELDEDIRVEIAEAIAGIIRYAQAHQ